MKEESLTVEVLKAMMERSRKMGRLVEEPNGITLKFGITASDAKHIKKVEFPVEINGSVITYDSEGLTLTSTLPTKLEENPEAQGDTSKVKGGTTPTPKVIEENLGNPPKAQDGKSEDKPKVRKPKTVSDERKASIELGLNIVKHLQTLLKTPEDRVKINDLIKTMKIDKQEAMDAANIMVIRKKVQIDFLPENPKHKMESGNSVKTTPWLSLTKTGFYFEKSMPVPQDLLMWVGGMGYPLIKDFIEETATMEISKRVSHIPKDLKLGETRIFLAHDEGEIGDGVIFGYFTVERVDMLVAKVEDIPEELRDQVTPLLLSKARVEKERGSGWRTEEGAIYLMAKKDSLAVFEDYRDYNKIIEETGHRFRSFKRVDGDTITESSETKTAPSTRIKQVIKLKEESKGKRKQAWTEEERQAMLKMVEAGKQQGKSNLWSYRQFAKQTNRSVLAINYQHNQMMKQEDEKEEEAKA